MGMTEGDVALLIPFMPMASCDSRPHVPLKPAQPYNADYHLYDGQAHLLIMDIE